MDITALLPPGLLPPPTGGNTTTGESDFAGILSGLQARGAAPSSPAETPPVPPNRQRVPLASLTLPEGETPAAPPPVAGRFDDADSDAGEDPAAASPLSPVLTAAPPSQLGAATGADAGSAGQTADREAPGASREDTATGGGEPLLAPMASPAATVQTPAPGRDTDLALPSAPPPRPTTAPGNTAKQGEHTHITASPAPAPPVLTSRTAGTTPADATAQPAALPAASAAASAEASEFGRQATTGPAPESISAIDASGGHRQPAPAVNQSTGSTPTPFVLHAPVASQAWQQQLSHQLSGLTQRGHHQVELHLNPAELGPLSVSLKVDDQGAQAQFLSAHASVRAAVEQAIPQLREALAEQGIALGEASVGEQQRQNSGETGPGEGGRDLAGEPETEVAAATAADSNAPTAPLTERPGVDLYA